MRHLLRRAVCVRPVSYCCGQLAVINLWLAHAEPGITYHVALSLVRSGNQDCAAKLSLLALLALAAAGCRLCVGLPGSSGAASTLRGLPV
mgnify:CR=1 FL=1